MFIIYYSRDRNHRVSRLQSVHPRCSYYWLSRLTKYPIYSLSFFHFQYLPRNFLTAVINADVHSFIRSFIQYSTYPTNCIYNKSSNFLLFLSQARKPNREKRLLATSYLPSCPPVYLSVCLSVCLSVYLSA